MAQQEEEGPLETTHLATKCVSSYERNKHKSVCGGETQAGRKIVVKTFGERT